MARKVPMPLTAMTPRSLLSLLLPTAFGIELLLSAWLIWKKQKGWGDEAIGVVMITIVPALLVILLLRTRIKQKLLFEPKPVARVLVAAGIAFGLLGLMISGVNDGHLDFLPMAVGLYLQIGFLLVEVFKLKGPG